MVFVNINLGAFLDFLNEPGAHPPAGGVPVHMQDPVGGVGCFPGQVNLAVVRSNSSQGD